MRNYKATLLTPDGDHVSDFHGMKTKQEVWDEINDMGSRWIFYPISFVTTDERIVDVPEGGWDAFKGKSIKRARKVIAAFAEEICDAINEGFPVYHLDFQSAFDDKKL